MSVNVVRVAERIADAVAGYRRADGTRGLPTVEATRSAPLLVRPPHGPNAHLEKIEAVVNGSDWAWQEGRKPRLPFPLFRFVTSVAGDHDSRNVCGVIWAGADDIRCVADLDRGALVAAAFGPICAVRKQAFAVGYRVAGREVVRDMEVGSFCSVAVLDLLWHFVHPSFQSVKVGPEPELCDGRSVEWRQAREFYTVVHRRSGAGRSGGVLPHQRSVALAAHARRAHERVLRSERWGASRGKRVWVRSAWVGPKEWRDEASRQVYRVVESFGGQ